MTANGKFLNCPTADGTRENGQLHHGILRRRRRGVVGPKSGATIKGRRLLSASAIYSSSIETGTAVGRFPMTMQAVKICASSLITTQFRTRSAWTGSSRYGHSRLYLYATPNVSIRNSGASCGADIKMGSLVKRFQGTEGARLLQDALQAQSALQGAEAAISEISSVVKLEEHAANTAIIAQGGTDNDLLFIISGKVGIVINGREIAERLGGQHVGEMSLIDFDGAPIRHSGSEGSDGNGTNFRSRLCEDC